MLTIDDIKKALEMSEYSNGDMTDMAEDVEQVVFRRDIFEYGDEKDVDAHIDIELEYGEYMELHEGDPAFVFLSQMCEIPSGSDEFVLYRK